MALSSAILLILSFPNFNQPWCAWVALVPWLLSMRGLTARQAFGWSYLIGLLFFLGSMWWLVHVTVVGLVALGAYLALYFGVFGWLTCRLLHSKPKTRNPKRSFPSLSVSTFDLRPSTLIVTPAMWVALEYLRSHLSSGLGWNLLGYSQTSVLPVIQCADVAGVWGVSFVVALVNVAIAHVLASRHFRQKLYVVMGAIGCVAAVSGYGSWRLTQPLGGSSVKVAVVQGNIPQDEKWDEAFQQSIIERYARLTHQAAAEHPQLIIWPETSVPDILDVTEPLPLSLSLLAQIVQTPLLVGTPMGRVTTTGIADLTNSAALIDAHGTLRAHYEKLHLVPFGEFIPFESICPWLRTVLPPIGTFTPGHDVTVFEMPVSSSEFQVSSPNPKPETRNLKLAFSVLICFEDLFPDLARQFVQRGARFLVTITNDAWFGNTAAAYQHAQASTFRAVELRVPMVRAANTGWSGCIDAHGRWQASVHDAHGRELFIEGTAACEVTPSDSRSLYTRWGDWFPWLCLLGCLGGAIFAIMTR